MYFLNMNAKTSIRLRPSDGTGSVALGTVRPPTSPPATASGSILSRGTLQKYASRRSSSDASANTSRSRSILSVDGAGAGGVAPITEGHIQVVSSIECGEKVVSVVHTDDGAVMVGGLVNGCIKVFNSTSGSLMGVLDNEEVVQDAMPISRVRCKPYMDGHPNSHLAATYVSGYLRIWNFANGQCLGQVQDENKNAEYLCLSHNPFADVISVGLDNGNIKLYDERTLQVTSLLKKSLSSSKVDGHTNRVFCIANHPQNPHEFVSAGWDNTLQFLDYSTASVTSEVESSELQPHYLTSAQYLGKDFIVVGGTDKSLVRVFDRHKKSVIASIREMPNTGSGCGIYDIDVPSKSGHQQLTAPSNKFVVTNKTTISTIDFTR